MKKIKLFLLLLAVSFLAPLVFPAQAHAYVACSFTAEPALPNNQLLENRPAKMIVSGVNFNPADRYSVHLVRADWTLDSHIPTDVKLVSGKLEFGFGGRGDETSVPGNKQLKIWDSSNREACRVDYVVADKATGCTYTVNPREPGVGQGASITFSNLGNVVNVGGWNTEVSPSGAATVSKRPEQTGESTVSATVDSFDRVGSYVVTLKKGISWVCQTESIHVGETPGDPTPVTVNPEDRQDIINPNAKLFENLYCPTNGGGQGINTALGCIPVGDSNEFVGWFLKWALGIAGGVAFILMLMAGFQIMTAGGNPEKVQGGRELLNAAISGLVLIIFSIFLLKLIGVDILGLPGF